MVHPLHPSGAGGTEGYQMTVFRVDGLANAAHTLKVEVINTDGSYVVVDAFDVRP